MRYRLSVHIYYTLRDIFGRNFAAKIANAIAPPNVRYGGNLSDVANDLRKMKELQPEWPVWDQLDRAHEEYEAARTGAYVDTYGVSWG